jgi:hypothetical protein
VPQVGHVEARSQVPRGVCAGTSLASVLGGEATVLGALRVIAT